MGSLSLQTVVGDPSVDVGRWVLPKPLNMGSLSTSRDHGNWKRARTTSLKTKHPSWCSPGLQSLLVLQEDRSTLWPGHLSKVWTLIKGLVKEAARLYKKDWIQRWWIYVIFLIYCLRKSQQPCTIKLEHSMCFFTRLKPTFPFHPPIHPHPSYLNRKYNSFSFPSFTILLSYINKRILATWK